MLLYGKYVKAKFTGVEDRSSLFLLWLYTFVAEHDVGILDFILVAFFER